MDETTEVQHKVRRVRRTKEQIAADEAAKAIVVPEAPVVEPEPIPEPVAVADDRAQLYAMRIWEGQSPDMPRPERVMRVTCGVEAQGMSMLGVVLPK